MLKKIFLLVVPLAILAGGWYFLQSKKTTTPSPTPPLAQETKDTNLLSETQTDGEVSTTKNNADQQTSETKNATTSATAIVNDIANADISNNQTNLLTPDVNDDIDVTTLGVDNRLTDEEFENLKALMRNDRNLRLELLEEYRYNTDPERAKQLAALLGPYNDPEILQTASELAYSSDPISKQTGLDLLSRIQPRNNEARDIAIDLLTSETDPGFLVSTMNVLATPARSADASQRQLLNANLNNLYSHYDPRVRSHSLSLMGRWDKNSPESRASLTQGLTDVDPLVRSSAAYSIMNIQNPDDDIINGLLSIAESTDNDKSTRYAALEALALMTLEGTAARRYNIIKRNINRRVVTTE